MKTRMLYILLSVCLCMGPANAAQTRPAGWNPTPPTPQQEAMSKQIGQLDQAAIAAMNAGKYAQAEADARQSVALDNDPSGQELFAAALNAQGKDKQALQAYKIIAEAGTDQPRNLLPYALLLLKNGQYPQAVAACNKALPLVGFGDLMISKGDMSPDIIQSGQLETNCHICLGLTWTGGGVWGWNPNYDRALDQYTLALQLSPNDALANYYLGDVLKRLGLRAQAQAAYAKAVRYGEGDVRKAAQDALAGR